MNLEELTDILCENIREGDVNDALQSLLDEVNVSDERGILKAFDDLAAVVAGAVVEIPLDVFVPLASPLDLRTIADIDGFKVQS